MDQRAVRLALGLTIAGASMLITGVAAGALGVLGAVTSGLAAHDLRGLALALLAGGVVCGLGMGSGLAAAARADSQAVPAGAPWPAAGAGGDARRGRWGRAAGPVPRRPRSLMNPPPPSPPPLAPARPLGTPLGQAGLARPIRGAAVRAPVARGSGAREPGLVARRARPGRPVGRRQLRGVAPLAARPGRSAAAPAQRRVTARRPGPGRPDVPGQSGCCLGAADAGGRQGPLLPRSGAG